MWVVPQALEHGVSLGLRIAGHWVFCPSYFQLAGSTRWNPGMPRSIFGMVVESNVEQIQLPGQNECVGWMIAGGPPTPEDVLACEHLAHARPICKEIWTTLSKQGLLLGDEGLVHRTERVLDLNLQNCLRGAQPGS